MSNTKKSSLKVGIWGLGRAGYGMHCYELELYRDEFEIVAGCDIEQDHLDAFAKRCPNAKTYLDGDKFLADESIDVVSVAVRSTQHADYAIRALNAGKYVFAEKPVALTSEAVDKLEKAAKEHPGRLFCRHNRRFETAFNHVQEIIRSGILGNVYEIKLCRHAYQFRDDWQAIIDCGGGQLNNWGPHLIDHALRLLESPVASVWSDLKRVTALGDAEDHLKIVFRGENKRIIDVEISGGIAISSPVYAVYGTRGTLVCEDEQDIKLKYLHPDFELPKTAAHPETPPLNGSFGGSTPIKWVRKTIMVEPSNKANANDIYHHLYMAIREGVPFPVKLEEAFDVVRWTERVKLQNPDFPVKKDVFGSKAF